MITERVMQGAFPGPALDTGLAPASSNNLQRSVCPFWIAASNAVIRMLLLYQVSFWTLMSAPCLSSSSTI